MVTAGWNAFIHDIDITSARRNRDGSGISAIGAERRPYYRSKIAGEVIDLEACDLVILRAKHPEESDSAATARRHAQTHCNGYYQGH